ncbi:MAG: hypothetical protein ACYSTX_06430 [Planctomycetota bacterium]|jgi:hypothetical protein
MPNKEERKRRRWEKQNKKIQNNQGEQQFTEGYGLPIRTELNSQQKKEARQKKRLEKGMARDRKKLNKMASDDQKQQSPVVDNSIPDALKQIKSAEKNLIRFEDRDLVNPDIKGGGIDDKGNRIDPSK